MPKRLARDGLIKLGETAPAKRTYTKREVVEHLAASNALFPYMSDKQQAELILAKSAELNGEEMPSQPLPPQLHEWIPNLRSFFRLPKQGK